MTNPCFSAMQASNHEGVFWMSDPETGLRAFVGLHNTTLGPGLGGCRIMVYPNEQAALEDVLKLSRAMTYKNSLAGLPYGGGKTVIMLNKPEDKTPELIDSFARRLHLLRGSYYTAGDIGSNAKDMARIKAITPYVSGLAPEDGGLGDSSIMTGLGVYMGMKAAVKQKLGRDDMAGLKVAVQGTGKVGFYLMQHLVKEGCEIIATDKNEEAMVYAKACYPGLTLVEPDDIWKQEVDILSPNAIGGTVTEEAVSTTTASIIAGGANNPLTSAEANTILTKRGILFAPDFAINSGGVIVLSTELMQGTLKQAQDKTEQIYDTTLKVFHIAEERNMTTLDAAIALAEERIEKTSRSEDGLVSA